MELVDRDLEVLMAAVTQGPNHALHRTADAACELTGRFGDRSREMI